MNKSRILLYILYIYEEFSSLISIKYKIVMLPIYREILKYCMYIFQIFTDKISEPGVEGEEHLGVRTLATGGTRSSPTKKKCPKAHCHIKFICICLKFGIAEIKYHQKLSSDQTTGSLIGCYVTKH